MAGGGHVDSPAVSEGTAAVAGGAGHVEDGGYFRAEGPVMVMMSKRLRALRKKANRIAQIEEARSNGKSINKEQEEMLRSKPSVLLLIEEYERIRAPLQASVKEELADAEKAFLTQALQQRAAAAAAESEAAAQAQKESLEGSGDNDAARSEDGGEGSDGRKAEESQVGVPEVEAGEDAGLRDMVDSNDVVKLVELLYFGALFDIKVAEGAGIPGSEMEVLRWRREQERNSCLSYDVVSDDDATPPLTEQDLDAISALSRLLTIRSSNSGNHREAVQRCVEHVTKYFQGAEEPIDESLQLSYSQVKDWLRRIVMSEFFTRRVLDVNPEVAAAAAASGQFVSEALPEPQVPEVGGQPYTAGEGATAHYAPQEQAGVPHYYSGLHPEYVVTGGQDRGIPVGTAQHMLVSPVTSFVPHGGFTVAEPSQVHLQYPAHESLSSEISTQSGDSAQQPSSEGGYLPNGIQYTDPSVVDGLHQAQQPQQPQPQHGNQQQQQQPQIPLQGDGMSQVPPGQYMGASRGPIGGRLQNNPGRGYGGRSRGGRIPGRGGRGQYDHQMGGGGGGYGQGMYRGGPRGGRVPRGGGRGGSQGWGQNPSPPVSAQDRSSESV